MFRSYTHDNPPKIGNAKKIWDVLCNNYKVVELHYNPNCWGNGKENGWNTWACTIEDYNPWKWCGIKDGHVYLQSMVGSYQRVWLS